MTDEYYDGIAGGYAELHQEEQLKKVRIILDRLKLKKGDKLLDVGCGTGFYLDMFQCKVTGIDPSVELIKQYRGKHKVLCGGAEKMSFYDDYFDLVISITAVHNFDDIEQGLKEIERVGKGKYIFSILKRSPKFRLMEKLIKEIFSVDETVEEDKDVIFFCSKREK